jgi:hypothetical protein
MTDSNNHGRLSFFLSKESLYSDVIAEIESAFSIDEAFPASRNLTEKLLDILDLLEDSPRKTRWLEALKAVKNAAENGKEGGWPVLAVTSSSGNPLGGNFNYALAAFILQTPAYPDLEKIVFGIKCLFISVLIQKPIHHGLGEISKIFRRELRGSPNSYKFLHLLPEFSHDVPSVYFTELQDVIETLDKYENDKNIDELLKRIKNLLLRNFKDFSPEIKKIAPLQSHSTIVIDESSDKPQENNNLLLISRILKTKNRQIAEPPDCVDLVTIEDREDDSIIEIDTKIKESNFWLRRHHKLVPSDWGRLNEAERQKLIQFVSKNIKSQNTSERNSAGLIGLIYLTGCKLENLLHCSVGKDQVFSIGGIYRREIRLPADAWTSSEEQNEYFEDSAKELVLQLPDFISEFVSNLCTDDISSIGDVLALDLEAAIALVKNALVIMREGRLYDRITLDRLHTALAIEVSLMFQDPVVTFQLASSSNQAAPMLGYYVAHKVEKLVQCYSKITEQMVSI